MAEMYYPPMDLAASNTDSGQRCPERAGEPANDLLLSLFARESLRIGVALSERARELGLSVQRPKHEGDAGLDLQAMIDTPEQTVTILPHESKRIPTGLFIDMPDTPGPFVLNCQILSRTGLGMRGLRPWAVLVDPGYRPERDDPNGLVLGLGNEGKEPVEISLGDRVAQAVFSLALGPSSVIQEVGINDINFNTNRGSARFGSTGR